MTTPDLGASMTDFSFTPQHLDDGRAAAEALLDQLGREPVPRGGTRCAEAHHHPAVGPPTTRLLTTPAAWPIVAG